jgi:hypothetical protein
MVSLWLRGETAMFGMSVNREGIPCSFVHSSWPTSRPSSPCGDGAVSRGPGTTPRKDIQRKLDVRPELFLVGLVEGVVVASVMAGHEGHRGWINYLAVLPEFQGKGFGRVMMGEAERRLRDAGCPKINLQVRSSNTAVIEFYHRLGYGVDDVVSMGKRLVHDEPGC